MMDGVPQLGVAQFGDVDVEPISGVVAGREPGTEEPGAAPVSPSGEATPGDRGVLADGFCKAGLPDGALRAGLLIEVCAQAGPANDRPMAATAAR